MPFTFSHPAIVVPLAKYYGRWFSVTGLIIGSMTPDFFYFLRVMFHQNFSHSILGAFLFDLPAGLLFSFIFHNYVRNDLYKNLPRGIKSRIQFHHSFSWNQTFKKHYGVVIVSVMIGILSHFILDDFTHPAGLFVELFPIIEKKISLNGLTFMVYELLQYLSSIAGAIYL